MMATDSTPFFRIELGFLLGSTLTDRQAAVQHRAADRAAGMVAGPMGDIVTFVRALQSLFGASSNAYLRTTIMLLAQNGQTSVIVEHCLLHSHHSLNVPKKSNPVTWHIS